MIKLPVHKRAKNKSMRGVIRALGVAKPAVWFMRTKEHWWTVEEKKRPERLQQTTVVDNCRTLFGEKENTSPTFNPLKEAGASLSHFIRANTGDLPPSQKHSDPIILERTCWFRLYQVVISHFGSTCKASPLCNLCKKTFVPVFVLRVYLLTAHNLYYGAKYFTLAVHICTSRCAERVRK